MHSGDAVDDARSQGSASSDPVSGPHGGQLLWWWRWFWRVTLVVSLGYAWHCFYVPSNDIAWGADYTSAQEQAARSGKPLILFFTGEWCVPCRIMKRNVWADEQVTASVNSGFVPVMIDVDDPEAATVRDRFGVGSTPTTIITDPRGETLLRAEGGMGKADFLELLAKAGPSAAPLDR